MIPFSRYRVFYYSLSLLLIAVSIFGLFVYGLRSSIDFAGGTLVEFTFETETTKDVIIDALARDNLQYASIQSSGNTSFLIRGDFSTDQVATVSSNIASVSGQNVIKTREEIVGPIIGGELLRKMTIAAGLAILGILVYIALTFKNITYGLAAIIALLHDTFILFGVFALLGHFYKVEVDALFVTAVLTTMSFSVHDTIVVFDRIREKLKENPQDNFMYVADQALTETMTRSVNNSITIAFMLLTLFLLGGDTTKWFVLALLIGTIAGTYSSPFVAAPVLYELQRRGKKKK